MPGTPRPVGANAGLPTIWNATKQAIQDGRQQNAALAAGATQGMIPDQYGNITELSGSNLDQIVTIGASTGVAGVKVSTGLPAGTAGRAVQSGPAITTITLTKGSTSATVGTVSGASLAVGQVIGAANVSDPSSGVATPAITPGTTITAVSGTSVTLSEAAAESGTNLYCAASRFILQQDTGWIPLTLPSGITPAGSAFVPSARLQGDLVTLKGVIDTSATVSAGATIATAPTNMHPSVTVTALMWASNTPMLLYIQTDGTMFLSGNWSSSYTADFNGVSYPIA